MKYYYLLFFFITVTALQSCHVGANGTWVNDRIDKDVRNEITGLDKQLFSYLLTKNTAGVKQMMAPMLLEKSGKKMDTLIKSINTALKTANFRILDEFYTRNTTTNIVDTIFSSRANNNDYKVEYLALNEEMYVSIMVSKNLPVNFMVMAIYGKYSSGWKINILYAGEHNILGKTAPDYYAQARAEYDQGNMINAVDQIIIASAIAQPAGKYFIYNSNEEMKEFYSTVLREANAKYHFPIVLNEVKTKPQIFAVSPKFVDVDGYKGIFPIIKYQSVIPLTDTVALKAENNEVRKSTAKIFKGVEQNHGLITYQAFNQMPDGKTVLKHYVFIQKLK